MEKTHTKFPLTALSALMALACLTNYTEAGVLMESTTAPTTNVIESLDRADSSVNGESPLATLFKNGAAANQEQHVGQSFQFASPFTVTGVTIQYSTFVADGAEAFTFAAGQTMRLNITEDTNSDGTPDSIVMFEDFDMGGRTAENFEYWTFTLASATGTLDANKAYGFMFEWRTTNGSNIFRVEQHDDDPYSGGGLLAQFNPTSLYPTPSASSDITFYLQGSVDAGGGNDFSDWIAGFNVGAQTGIDDDPDNDGVDSGVENFFGTAPDEFTQGLVTGAADTGAGTFTFAHPQTGTLADDLTATYQWSVDLASFFADGVEDGGVQVDFVATPNSPSPGTTTVVATVTGPVPEKLFVSVKVTQP